MTELAYREPWCGKAHRHDTTFARRGPDAWLSVCGARVGGWERVPVEQVDPADLCKRCWPERAS
jgi:hypothetical protein